ncbi:hypothetical protein ACGFW5_06295 [Streptomyces sp. NPDC048416]|uniref:hypothetical protein n=1 Tax=Streptomyces sp. NPDC048416 TaxID=3365546 RepID=UPI003715573A
MTELHLLLFIVVAEAGLLGAAGGGILAHWSGASAAKTARDSVIGAGATLTFVISVMVAAGIFRK